MKICLVALLLATSASAFMPCQQRAFVAQPTQTRSSVALRMADDEKPGALVPIKQETVEFTAGILGATAGFFLGGPVLAFIVGAATNYASKMEGDVGDVVQAVSKSSIEVFNYLSTLDSKYELLSKAKGKLEETVDKLKSQGNVDPTVIDKVEGALDTTTKKIAEINDEYDLVGAGVTALGVVGDLVEKAVKKASELNEEYGLSGKALDALKTSVDKAKEAANDAKAKL